jgi:hypothetical protein
VAPNQSQIVKTREQIVVHLDRALGFFFDVLHQLCELPRALDDKGHLHRGWPVGVHPTHGVGDYVHSSHSAFFRHTVVWIPPTRGHGTSSTTAAAEATLQSRQLTLLEVANADGRAFGEVLVIVGTLVLHDDVTHRFARGERAWRGVEEELRANATRRYVRTNVHADAWGRILGLTTLALCLLQEAHGVLHRAFLLILGASTRTI